MAHEQRKNNFNILLIVAIFLVIFAFSVFLYSVINKPLERRVYDINFKVGENLGFDINNTALTFGKIIPGSEAERTLNITNHYTFPVKIRALASREIANLLISEEVIIDSGNTSEFPVRVSIPLNHTYGEYKGKIIIEIRKI